MKTNYKLTAIPVLDKGWVCLRDFMGTDMDIVQTARESTTADLKGDEKDKKLLEYLYRSGHVSPFSYPQIAFRMYMPIFVMRQFVRHWTLSMKLNEMSGRYSVLPDDVYIPKVWRKPDKKNHQGSIDGFTDEENSQITGLFEKNVQLNKLLEDQMLEGDVAKEMARFNQLVGQYTRISVVGSLRDWMLGFLRQRLDPHAQQEIREYAFAIAHFLNLLYPNTMQLFFRYTLGALPFTLDDFQNPGLEQMGQIREIIEAKVQERKEIWSSVLALKPEPLEVIMRRKREE